MSQEDAEVIPRFRSTGGCIVTIVEEKESPPIDPPRRSFSLVRTQRTLQIILGLFWLLDAGLQFQPFMFRSSFTTTYLLNNAQNQPDVVRWIITNVGHFVGPHVAVWNTFFALIQVAIGAGLLFRRTVRPALAVSFFWAFGVWFFGEGLGLIFTGSASALTGAPGSVFIYGLIGMMAWPRSRTRQVTDQPVGMASSAAGQGIGGATTPLLVWSGYWSLAAVLFLLPNNRTTTSVSSAITGMSSGEPSAYSHFLNSFGNQFGSGGVWTTWLLAIASLIVGFGPLLFRRPTPVPRLGWPPGRLLLGQRPGSRRHLHRFWHGPQHRSSHHPPGPGHGARRVAGPVDMALPLRDGALSVSRAGRRRRGGSRGRSVSQCRLPGGRSGVVEHGNVGHGRHVRDLDGRARAGRLRRRPHAREGTTAHRGRGWTSITPRTWSWRDRAPA